MSDKFTTLPPSFIERKTTETYRILLHNQKWYIQRKDSIGFRGPFLKISDAESQARRSW